MSELKKLVVIDGKSVFYRGYYAMPSLSKADGTPTGGVYGFMMMALEVIKKFDPDYVCVAWDKSKTNIRSRKKLYPQYKANRKPAPEDFKVQIPLLKELLEALHWPLYEIDDYEADDIMGTFAKQASSEGLETLLITGDHDVLQTVSNDVKVAIMKKGITNIDIYTPETFKAKYQMNVEQFIDYKALRGDPSDNIPGVAGVGEKTATDLIQTYGSLEGVYKNLELIKGATAKKLASDKEMAFLSEKLVRIVTDVPLKVDYEQADVNLSDPDKLLEVLQDLEFTNLIKQLPQELRSSAAKDENIELDTGNKVVRVAHKGELEGLSFKSDRLMVLPRFASKHGRDLQSIIISDGVQTAYVINLQNNLDEKIVFKKITNLFKDKRIIGFETKLFLQSLLNHKVTNLPKVEFDLKIASFVLDPLQREVSLESVLKKSLGYDLQELAHEEAVDLAGKINSLLWALYDYQKTLLKKQSDLKNYLQNIEFDFVPIIAKMEFYGIKIDKHYFKKFGEELSDMISDLEQTIYGMAGKEFNVASPSQLSKILFEDLALPTSGIKRGKTSYSTAAGELLKLRSEHEIIDSILEFRESSKLQNTYVRPLPEMLGEDGRLHSSFSQTTASTGRLSSSDPNVQNIPIRTPLGQRIRKGLVAEEGFVLIQADYSQFELRIAASLSEDENLINIFNQDIDVHTQTAVRVLGVAEGELTKDQRSHAKAINFGILYGQGAHGLSMSTGMTLQQAQDFIDKYYQTYPDLKKYLDSLQAQAVEEGYVQTLLGRKRPTPDAKSSNTNVRNAAIRAAINMPIQGTAADLVKIAMIEIDKKLDAKSKQVLQIHDSIIVETPAELQDQTAASMKEIMERVYALPVKLKIDLAIGKDWGAL